ncbi:CalY family protein [Oceanobacillus polygoni]|uniref:Spore coat-associated protein N n=1 Tax=Oceanobacillus polygoni TaxID=1235259 RepID=A0A9X0YUF1_9BACI|nr:CalY family protein [Oceanobacillus polygoni]MBP2078888.1 spore coat-associated protein N [Oceanobacillus polygoni]
MSLKKKLGAGVATAVLGLGLIGGGVFAYFSDSEVSNNTFAAGTLDLALNPTEIINVDNIKPGDTMLRPFTLSNNGTLDIKTVDLSTGYTVNDVGSNNSEDFGKHIRVNFLANADKLTTPIWSTTLADLQNASPELVHEKFWLVFWEERGLAPNTSDTFYVQFEFVDNGEDQNEFQGDSLNLEWTFNAKQGEGQAK